MQSKEDAGATYDKANLTQNVFDLFLAGTETTATTLRWALLYMVAYPDVQGKHTQFCCFLEITHVQIVAEPIKEQQRSKCVERESGELHASVSSYTESLRLGNITKAI